MTQGVFLRAAFAAVLCTLALAPVAGAARLPAPKLVQPAAEATVRTLPSFTWTKVARAASYDFEIAADNSFSSPVEGNEKGKFRTNNTAASLLTAIPNHDYWWRVRAVTADGSVSPWTKGRQFTMDWIDVPTPLSPEDRAEITFPKPATLVWSPVAGAAKYRVELARDESMGSLVYNRDLVYTQATRFTPEVQLQTGTYYWRITPVDAQGHDGTASPIWSFAWRWPATVSGLFVDDLRGESQVFEPRFNWNKVPGATGYNLEVSKDANFAAGSFVCCGTSFGALPAYDTLRGNSYSPLSRLDDDATYYWRVRAVDTSGTPGPFMQGGSFQQQFGTTSPSIANLHMRDNVSDPAVDLNLVTPGLQTRVPVVVWDPVPGATGYDIDVVPHTGVICDWGDEDEALRKAVAVPYWTPLGATPVGAAPFNPDLNVSNDGSGSYAGSGSWCVRVRPRAELDQSSNDLIRGDWTYLGGSDNSIAWIADAFPTGGTPAYLDAGEYLAPVNTGVVTRTPLLTWSDVADSYYVIVASDANFHTVVDFAFTRIPAYAPREKTNMKTFPNDATLYWAVLPAAANGSSALQSPTNSFARFSVQALAPGLLTPMPGGEIVGHPSFRWTPVEGARDYLIEIASDPGLDNILESRTMETAVTSYTSARTYASDLIYWRVQARDVLGKGLTRSQVGSFTRILAAPSVPLETNIDTSAGLPTWAWDPVDGAATYDVEITQPDGKRVTFAKNYSTASDPTQMTGTGTFAWRVQARFPSSGATVPGRWSPSRSFTRIIPPPLGAHVEQRNGLVLAWDARPGATNYTVEVSRREDFKQLVERVQKVDPPNYAPKMTKSEYTDGGVLYWRVAARDLAGNVGSFTQIQKLVLSPRMLVKADGRPAKGKLVLVKLKVTTFDKKNVNRAFVRATGKALKKPVGGFTNKQGVLVLRLKATKSGPITYTVSKKKYQPVTTTVLVY